MRSVVQDTSIRDVGNKAFTTSTSRRSPTTQVYFIPNYVSYDRYISYMLEARTVDKKQLDPSTSHMIITETPSPTVASRCFHADPFRLL